MLTHTIRALTLLVLVVIAHVVKPFSLENLITFALTATASITQVLPEKTLGKLEKAGLLAVVVTGNWNRGLAGESLLSSRLSNQVNVAPPPAMVAAQSWRTNDRTGQNLTATRKPAPALTRSENVSGRSRVRFGAAPLPAIPGLNLSLLPNSALLAQPQLPLSARVLPKSQPSKILVNPVQSAVEEAPAMFPKESSWTSEEVFFGPISSAFQPQTIQLRILSQRPVSGAACAQPVQGMTRPVRVSRQSC